MIRFTSPGSILVEAAPKKSTDATLRSFFECFFVEKNLRPGVKSKNCPEHGIFYPPLENGGLGMHNAESSLRCYDFHQKNHPSLLKQSLEAGVKIWELGLKFQGWGDFFRELGLKIWELG